MPSLNQPATGNSPAIRFHQPSSTLRFVGESFPENVIEAYAPARAFIDEYFEENPEGPLELLFELSYFNTSTSKILYDIFASLASRYRQGARIRVEWRYPKDIEVMQEHGEDFASDVDLPFVLVPQ